MSTATEEALSPVEADEFRAKVHAFLKENAVGIDGAGRGTTSIQAGREFQAKLAAAGLAGIVYPKELGGAGLTRAHERIYREEYAKFPDMTYELVISHGMCLPVLNQFGTEEQKKQFMPDNIAARTMWCQMFSEPGAGSDVASLQTKAELDGDEWVINGQKVWTTLAHVCDYGVIIARTNPEAPKHAGISMFIVDMKAPGVEIRPIHQIDGGSHFNEIFLTDVRIPKSWLLGELNNGWNQATAMLMFERVAIGTGSSSGVSHVLADRLIEVAKRNGKISDPVVRQELMKIYCEESTKSMVAMRTRAEMKAGKVPGPGGSLGKLHGARIAWASRPLISRLVGLDSDAWEPGGRGENWARQILNSFQSSIAGGTDEIQRNIIGDRVLGLPREPMVDKDLPFKDLKVGTQR
ncbi:MAG: acyl-CoA dehydrogenase family protein [Ilumatobacteraceae bacterium]|jgi:alkylation response protein AidB-like acyl-CoA dehydrogenase|nr:acyl-CoA dehydrogenase family protein [Ilumatobacteraceae bacterium]